jgi:hypothetical protein
MVGRVWKSCFPHGGREAEEGIGQVFKGTLPRRPQGMTYVLFGGGWQRFKRSGRGGELDQNTFYSCLETPQ